MYLVEFVPLYIAIFSRIYSPIIVADSSILSEKEYSGDVAAESMNDDSDSDSDSKDDCKKKSDRVWAGGVYTCQ